MAGVEIERKFLFRPCAPKKFLNDLGVTYTKYSMQQYYISTEKYPNIRYRKKNNNFYKTIKSGDGLVRREEEFAVTQEEFLKHLDKHSGRIIEKDRFVFVYDDITYELDIFKKDLKGLCYLEVEFSDEISAKAFELPDIFSSLNIAEVTEDSRFNNVSLSIPGSIPSLHTDLEKLDRKMKLVLPKVINTYPISIEPFESTETAILAMLQNKAQKIDECRKNLLDEPNSFDKLYDFWVSMRKAKAVLEEFEEFFDSTWFSRHLQNISQLMAQTNAKRDIGLFLVDIENYRGLLSNKRSDDLDKIVNILKNKYDEYEAKTTGLANSELLTYEISALERPKIDKNQHNKTLQQPIVISVMRILQNRIENIIQDGKDIDRVTNLNGHHHLRIQFKKLCCIIEDTETFILNDKYVNAITMVKNIENLLGEYHDLQFQRIFLISLLNDIGKEDTKMKKTIKKLRDLINIKELENQTIFQKDLKLFMNEHKNLKQLFKY
ncbi:hypothetical protein MNB_SV-6-1852 [hydrothermal vent metagenome]|uniref:CYTH domain-containing protein n=1 Tax=hydrothermal vent metagenome TaxID=652676 RepID=A0A1W1C426_9ZZZZ